MLHSVYIRLAGLFLVAMLVFAGCGAEQAGETPVPDDVDRTIEIVTRNMSFAPNTIVLRPGEKVALVLDNPDSMVHDLTIDDFFGERLKIETQPRSKAVLVLEVPETTGEFRFYCSVPGHEALGMVGTLIVE